MPDRRLARAHSGTSYISKVSVDLLRSPNHPTMPAESAFEKSRTMHEHLFMAKESRRFLWSIVR